MFIHPGVILVCVRSKMVMVTQKCL